MISDNQKSCNIRRKGMRGKWSRKDYTPEEIEYIKFIGLKIKKRRKQLRLTQSDVGKLIFTTFQQVQKYEKGTNVINNTSDRWELGNERIINWREYICLLSASDNIDHNLIGI